MEEFGIRSFCQEAVLDNLIWAHRDVLPPTKRWEDEFPAEPHYRCRHRNSTKIWVGGELRCRVGRGANG